MENINNDSAFVVSTVSNDVSTSNLAKMSSSTVGNNTGLLPANNLCTPFLEGPSFTQATVPDLAAFLPADHTDTDQFKLVTLPNVFPIPYSTATISGPLNNDSVSDALLNIADPAGPQWIQFILGPNTLPKCSTLTRQPKPSFLQSRNLKHGPPQLSSPQAKSHAMCSGQVTSVLSERAFLDMSSHLQFADTKDKTGFSILSLIPPSGGKTSTIRIPYCGT